LLGLWLKQNGINKKIYLLDSFEGLPSPDEINDKGYKKGQFKSNFDKVKAEVEKHELSDIISIHKGWFSETVPKIKSKLKIALLHVDCDLYTSTNDCFPELYPLVSNGGAIVFDDLNDGGGGEKKAVHEYFEQYRIDETINLSPAPQSFILKGEKNKKAILVGKQAYSSSYIVNNLPYLQWLKENYDIKLINNINLV